MTPSRVFDYVVVGGGSAGCVAAARLAADGRFSVALLEAGRKDVNRWIHIPATFFRALQSRDATSYASEPDPSLDGREFVVPQGNVLGGGSSVNGMIYMRGQARDYDEWEALHGCPGWSHADVLPVFMSQERNTRLGAPHHGQAGPLTVSDPGYRHPVTAALIGAAREAGLPATEDFNGATQEGAGWYQVTAARGRRNSAATAFLRPALGRGTLSLMTGCQVLRVVFSGRRATGVEALTPDGPARITARREVILAAGSFRSPAILMQSGIGPAAQLARAGIALFADSPELGANYQDHVGVPVTMRLRPGLGLHGADRGLRALRHGAEYALLRRGLLTSNLLEGGACADTDGDGRPDVQFNFAPFAPGPPGHPPLPFDALQAHPMTMRPRSRGRLVLASADPGAPLRFEAGILREEADMDTLRRGVRLAREILSRLAPSGMLREEVWPGADVSDRAGSNRLDTAIRAQARTIFHPAGTCRMGSDAEAVVDARLRVRGAEGLRIADCSIMPAIVSGNTNAPTMMIAERCASFALSES